MCKRNQNFMHSAKSGFSRPDHFLTSRERELSTTHHLSMGILKMVRIILEEGKLGR